MEETAITPAPTTRATILDEGKSKDVIATLQETEAASGDYWKGMDRGLKIAAPPPPPVSDRMSPTIAKLAFALAKAQGGMENAKKDTANPFFKSKYADLASCVDACRGPMSANGLSYFQRIDTTSRSAAVVTVLLHESGEWMENGRCSLPITDKATAQAYGSVITYARRYSLCAALGIAAEDDDGNAAAGTPPAGAKSGTYARQPQEPKLNMTPQQQEEANRAFGFKPK